MNADTYLKFANKLNEVIDEAYLNDDEELKLALTYHNEIAKEKGITLDQQIYEVWEGHVRRKNDS